MNKENSIRATSGPVIIAGMHRSGTSLVASLVSGMGIDLGTDLVPADRFNVNGYFEDAEVVGLQARVLTRACTGGTISHPDWGWSDSEHLDMDRALADYDAEFRSFLESRAGRTLWGWKDPRTTLFLDYWMDRCPKAVFLLVYRPPWEVAVSMRDMGNELALRHPSTPLRIWRFYNRRLLAFRDRHPDRCILCDSRTVGLAPDRLRQLLEERVGAGLPGSAAHGIYRDDLMRRIGADDPYPRLLASTYPDIAALHESLIDCSDIPPTVVEIAEGSERVSTIGTSGRAEPRVTVILPCRNDGEYLLEAVASIERIGRGACETIVIDDGSDDAETANALRTVRHRGHRVIRQPPSGLASARNSGIEASRTPYFLPLDADNRLLAPYLESAVVMLDDNPNAAVAYGDERRFGLESETVASGVFSIERLIAENYIDACAVVRKAAWEDSGGYDKNMRIWEDWEFWLNLASNGWRFLYVPKVCFEYRVRPGSLISLASDDSLVCDLIVYMTQKHAPYYEGETLREEIGRHYERLAARSSPGPLRVPATRLAHWSGTADPALCQTLVTTDPATLTPGPQTADGAPCLALIDPSETARAHFRAWAGFAISAVTADVRAVVSCGADSELWIEYDSGSETTIIYADSPRQRIPGDAQWATLDFRIHDIRFRRRIDGADFRIIAKRPAGIPVYVRSVTVTLVQ